jgi:hypothetical protein
VVGELSLELAPHAIFGNVDNHFCSAQRCLHSPLDKNCIQTRLRLENLGKFPNLMNHMNHVFPGKNHVFICFPWKKPPCITAMTQFPPGRSPKSWRRWHNLGEGYPEGASELGISQP